MAVVTPVTSWTNRRGAFAQAESNGPMRSQHRGGAGYRTQTPPERMGSDVNHYLGELLQGVFYDWHHPNNQIGDSMWMYIAHQP